MKKFFSLIALVGVIAACTPEQVNTAFKLAGGKVLVDVEVVDIINGGQYAGPVTVHIFRGGLDVTQEFTPIVGAGPHSFMWQADDSDPVPAGDYVVGVEGTELAKTYTSNFVFPAVLAGGEAKIKVIVPVGEPINGWTPDLEMGKTEELPVAIAYLVNNEYPTHDYSHGGVDAWYYNNTEFAVPGSIEYTWGAVGFVENVVDNGILGFEGVVDATAEYLSFDESEDDEYYFTVSAWAMWNVTQTNFGQKIPCSVIAFKDANENEQWDEGEEKLELGSFDWFIIGATALELHELAYPGAEGHYTPGHGHDAHGTMPNAGGGMSIND